MCKGRRKRNKVLLILSYCLVLFGEPACRPTTPVGTRAGGITVAIRLVCKATRAIIGCRPRASLLLLLLPLHVSNLTKLPRRRPPPIRCHLQRPKAKKTYAPQQSQEEGMHLFDLQICTSFIIIVIAKERRPRTPIPSLVRARRAARVVGYM
ncbi:hypothetical protein BKA80DRAFT_92972 [Phyllosticta citrichinensis]